MPFPRVLRYIIVKFKQYLLRAIVGCCFNIKFIGCRLQQQMAGIAQVGGIQGQLLTHQGNTYLVQGGTMDGEGHPLTHTTRASPATVSI